MKRLVGVILALLALAMPARAQSTWATPQTASGGTTVPGGVGLCLNGTGLAVPCGASTPTYVYPGTGATWNIGTGGLGTAAAPLSMAGAASSNYAPSQVSVAATATNLIAARSGGRNAVVITNMSTTPVFLGGSGVTAATGGYLAGVVGAVKVLPYNGAIYGITATGTASVSVEEIY